MAPTISPAWLPLPDVLVPLRHWLDELPIQNESVARRICQLIPSQCPFARTITLLGVSWHIPPLCKLNPLYDELISLRLRALSYLTDDCGIDVTQYIC